jgi:hypothetical protein
MHFVEMLITKAKSEQRFFTKRQMYGFGLNLPVTSFLNMALKSSVDYNTIIILCAIKVFMVMIGISGDIDFYVFRPLKSWHLLHQKSDSPFL